MSNPFTVVAPWLLAFVMMTLGLKLAEWVGRRAGRAAEGRRVSAAIRATDAYLPSSVDRTALVELCRRLNT